MTGTVLTEGRHSAECILSEANGMRSRDNITIKAGSGVIPANTVVGKITATGFWIASPVSEASGEEGAGTAKGITLYEVDATDAAVEVAALVRDCEVNKNLIAYAASADTDPEQAAKQVSLALVGIICR